MPPPLLSSPPEVELGRRSPGCPLAVAATSLSSARTASRARLQSPETALSSSAASSARRRGRSASAAHRRLCPSCSSSSSQSFSSASPSDASPSAALLPLLRKRLLLLLLVPLLREEEEGWTFSVFFFFWPGELGGLAFTLLLLLPIAIAHSAHRSCIAFDHHAAEVAAPSPAASAAASMALLKVFFLILNIGY